MQKLRITLSICLITTISLAIHAQNWNNDSILVKLDETLNNKQKIESAKLDLINIIKSRLEQTSKSDIESKYLIVENLFEEYKSFSYDSAFKYVSVLSKMANESKEQKKILSVKIKMGFILLSSGLFKEAIDTLLSVNPQMLEPEQRIEYYSILGRTYHDLADYDASPFYTAIYNKKGNFYLEQALEFIPEYSFQYYLIRGSEQLKADQFESARETFLRLFNNISMSEHKRAITASTLGYIYTCLKKRDKAIYLLAVASIADIKSSTKETVALRNLAHLLYENGETERAHRYIKIALEDAEFYNARHRKKEVGNILPLIEAEYLQNTQKQKKVLEYYLLIISILGIVAFILLIISSIQFYRLKKVKELLQSHNDIIEETNKKLSEANRIKEKYIGYYFNVNSNYLERIEKLQKNLVRKINARQFDDLQEYIKSDLDPEKEREELNTSFDKIILGLFPNFVEQFNLLLNKEDQIELKENQLLNKELRIFALMRMGISDIEKIAKILNCSVNTIYTYKTI